MSTSGSSTGLITPITIDSSGGLTTGSTLTNTGAGGTTQIVGIASGIDTTELIQAELAEDELPLTNIQDQVTGLTTENNTLSSIQTALQTVSFDAEILGEPSTFFPTQTIDTSDSSLVTAATTNGPGAPIGSTTLTIDSLASASQSAYAWTAPADSDTMVVQVGSGTAQSVTIAAGDTAEQAADTINGDSSLGVYATTQTVNGTTQLILSAANTGTGNIINAGDTQGALGTADGSATLTSGSTTVAEATPVSQEDGVNASYTVNGVTESSGSDTVTNAIPGVSLTLLGVTGDTPVTVTAEAPGPNTTAINTAVQQFVTDYNTALSTLDTDINTAPASEGTPSDYSPYSGSLFGDDELEELMSDMRTTLESSFSGTGISATMDNLSQIGITTAGTSGSVTSNDEEGQLSVDTTTLDAAIESNPSGVQALLTSWSSSMTQVLNNASGVSGAIATRIQGNDSIITNLNSQLTSQEALYNQEEQNMEEQWAQVESTLEDLDDQKTNFSDFADGLSTSSTTSSSS